MLPNRHVRRIWDARRGAAARIRLGRPLGDGPLARIWWVVLLRAIAAIAFGLVVIVWPHHAAVAMVTAFGLYAVLDGGLGLLLSAWPGALRAPGLGALAAFANIAAGVAALAAPQRIAQLLVLVLGVWLAVRGLAVFAEALADVRARRRGPTAPAQASLGGGEFGALLDGIMAAIFGLALLVSPQLGVLTLAWALGIWAMLHGVLMSVFALQQRGLVRTA
jgi:uncharacterized membrane protein HdeD (DUF308 family)